METPAAALHASILEQVAESFGQAYFVYKCGEQRLEYINKAFTSLFGITKEDALQDASRLIGCVHPEDQQFVLEQYARVLEKEHQEGVEIRVVGPGQDLRWINLCWQVLDAGEHRYISGYAEDITKLKEYQNNILKFNSKKNSTLEILSHDLAAPFANIEGMVGLLETEITSPNPAILELLDYVKTNAKKGSDMIRDFVDNEFLESSQVVLHKERENLTYRIGVMISNYTHTGRGLVDKVFKVVLPPEPVFVYLDAMKFLQALNNLVSNAIKFTEDDGTIIVSLHPQHDTVVIKVSDNGIGIPDDLKPHLFDKFTKARREGLRGEKSVGLGMSIIKTIVELHNGRIWFESEEGKGSTFFIEVPKN